MNSRIRVCAVFVCLIIAAIPAIAALLDPNNPMGPGGVIMIDIGSQAFGIAYSADGKMALVSNHGDGTISVIDLTTNQTRTFKAGTGIETLAYY